MAIAALLHRSSACSRLPASALVKDRPRTLRATGRGMSVFRLSTRRPAHRPAPHAPGNRLRPRPFRPSASSPVTSRRARRPAAAPRPLRWPTRTPCRRPAGCGRAGCCGPGRRGRRSRRAGTPAALSAASVATTAIVVFSGSSGDGSCGECVDLFGRRRRQRELFDRGGHPGQTGAPVDDVARGVHHDDRAHGHAGRQCRRRRADAALEHTGPRPHAGADRPRRRRAPSALAAATQAA